VKHPDYNDFFRLKPLKEEKIINQLKEDGIYGEPRFNF